MIKKFRLLFATMAIAVVAIALTARARTIAVTPVQETQYYWQINEADEDDPLSGASYTQISSGAYTALSCSGNQTVCKLKSSSSALPGTMTDSNADGIPDVTGVVKQVFTRSF